MPVDDLHLSSLATTNGTRAVLFYYGVLHAARVYSFDCSTNALVLERVVDYQGFNAEPYHESFETTLTPDGWPVSWRLLYRKDRVKKDGNSPLVFLPCVGFKNGGEIMTMSTGLLYRIACVPLRKRPYS
ncbi:hypothetical protein H632_c2322p0 [Helicosporidium sp. ATCC 50920]|nr:hypothetical protein H632_c2322p0 [Helicosporidium sp. ATCC 50920]|eukprot:KDD73305.1 hypothetical protein H632_c2322p0 [Helicosporidium sp. ATCC 50920]